MHLRLALVWKTSSFKLERLASRRILSGGVLAKQNAGAILKFKNSLHCNLVGVSECFFPMLLLFFDRVQFHAKPAWIKRAHLYNSRW